MSKSLFSWKPIYLFMKNGTTTYVPSKSLFSWKPIYLTFGDDQKEPLRFV